MHRDSYKAKAATGSGRTDWVVTGPCDCAEDPIDLSEDAYDCVRCDGHKRVVVKMDMTEGEALALAAKLNAIELTVKLRTRSPLAD